jgi:phage/conjugal plasmid C-4 type zinc finger TraR family protein
MEKYADVLDRAQAHIERETELRISAIRRRAVIGAGRACCRDCGAPIPEARRTQVPNAQCCAPCQNDREARVETVARRG